MSVIQTISRVKRVLGRSVVLVCVAAGMSGIPAAAEAQSWEGAGVITATSGCDGYAIGGGTFRVRYTAPLGTAGGDYRYGTIEARYAQGFVWRPTGTPFAYADAVGVGVGFSDFATTARIRQVSRSPAQLTSTTPFINLVLQIQNFDNTAGCNVTINNTLTLRIEFDS